jgi:FAD/FMN-containing dehydrogenase/Fe-S oxidoreductase
VKVSLPVLQDELRRRVDGEVRFDAGSRALYSTDASNYRLIPLGVVVPRHEADVAAALALARENEVAILPRGGGTSLAGQTCNRALVLDFSKYLNSIRKIDPERGLAIVEPGVVLTQLNSAAAKFDLQFAPDPTTRNRCCLGGMIGNNSCGAHSVQWGKTVDNLIGIDALLYDGTQLLLGPGTGTGASEGRPGEILARLRALQERYAEAVRNGFPRIPRRVSGYNLDQLLPESGFNIARALVGSEGTLAITQSATVRLVARPRCRALLVMGFADMFEAADQVALILEHRPQALEGFDNRLIEFCRLKAGATEVERMLPSGGGFLMVEFGAGTADEARGRAADLARAAEHFPARAQCRLFSDEREQAAVWELRESGLGASAVIAGRPRTWPGAEDTAVAPQHLGAFLRRFDALLARHGLQAATFYGHFGDGCVHCRIDFDFATEAGVRRFRLAMEQIADLVAEFGGSLSGEHGDGRARSELLPKIFGSKLIEAFAEFKRIFDPDNRMNPGVIVAPDALDDHLRVSRRRPPIENDRLEGLHQENDRSAASLSQPTHFDFSADHGFAGAASRCVGIGKCRRTEGGTMCPSYMATREEAHSTRGRAHLLFEALTGDFLGRDAADVALHDALDLCLACKGCKRECPAGVDMAAYKAEFLSHYYRRHRRPLSAHLFGRIHQAARMAQFAPHLANSLVNLPVSRTIAGRLFGIHRARRLPAFAAQSFRSWFRRRSGKPGARRVVLFPDTFTNFFEPQVGRAAVEVLERCGFTVEIPGSDLCCGRPLFDQGMLDLARRWLATIMEVMAPLADAGLTIVGLEPSCLLTLRDELPALFPGDARAARLARSSVMFDEFIARDADAVALPALPARTVLLHGHCHHKALAGLDSEIAILKRIAGLELQTPDSGCCGMAGAFGYDAQHYEISRAIGERVLLPAVRAAKPDTIIVSDGFSCRSQIAHFSGRRAMHLAELLNSHP